MGFVMVKKFVILSVRSVCKHPFLVGMAFLLIFMYRSFPLLFSLFLSASPVIVSTAVLLATLLSFGQPNLPEIEKEETISTTTTTTTTTTTIHHHKSLKSIGFGESDSIVVSKDRGFDDETERYYTEKEKQKDSGDEEEEVVVETSVMRKDVSSNVDDHVSEHSVADDGESVSKEKTLEQGIEEAVGESVGRGFEHENVDYLDKESPPSQVLNNHYSKIQHSDDEDEDEDERSDMEKDKLPEGPVGDQGADDADADEDDDDDDEVSDSGSDGAESSSPDASMADIIPMLDELHPLLDEEHPHTAQMSHDGSDAASEHSLASDEHTESDDDVVNHEEFEVEEVEEDEEEEEEEEESHAEKEDETKSAITWTEDDQKNLMNLGTSELERNQRLENLIARRRARKNMRLMAEKNLIDLESVDLPFNNIAPISTARQNPFDLPYDANDNVPGSAPSILLPRRNPFDLPYDSNEEKPDLAGDTFQQDFVPFHQPKEPFFRRHESFNVGPSIFGPPRQERQDYKLRPYFIPERMVMEGTSYSSFQRQSSELSESKMSSVPDTESNGSVGDLEDMKVTEEDVSQEPELISVADHASHDVDHRSQSSDDVETVELGQVTNRDVELDGIEVRLGDFEDHQEVDSSLSEPESEATPRELHSEIHMKTEDLEHQHSSISSSSSSTEINEENAIENEGEVLLEQTTNSYPHSDPSISVQPLTEEPQFNVTSLLVEESQPKEPVYDSSPPGDKKNHLFSTDLQVEDSQMGSPSVLVNEKNSSSELEFEASNQGVEKENLDNEEVDLDSSERNEVDDTDFTSRSLTDISKHDTHEGVHEESASQVEQDLPLPEKSTDESSSEHLKKEQVESDDEPSTIKMDPSEFQETDENFSSTVHLAETEVPPPSSPQDVEVENHDSVHDLEEPLNFDSHFEVPNNIEEVDEIDENFLHELDTVGDFSVNDLGTEKQILTDGGRSFLEERDLDPEPFGAIKGSFIEVLEPNVKVDAEDQLTHTGVSEPQTESKSTAEMRDQGAESSSEEDSSSRVFDVKQDDEKSSKSGSYSSTHTHDSGDER